MCQLYAPPHPPPNIVITISTLREQTETLDMVDTITIGLDRYSMYIMCKFRTIYKHHYYCILYDICRSVRL